MVSQVPVQREMQSILSGFPRLEWIMFMIYLWHCVSKNLGVEQVSQASDGLFLSDQGCGGEGFKSWSSSVSDSCARASYPAILLQLHPSQGLQSTPCFKVQKDAILCAVPVGT